MKRLLSVACQLLSLGTFGVETLADSRLLPGNIQHAVPVCATMVSAADEGEGVISLVSSGLEGQLAWVEGQKDVQVYRRVPSGGGLRIGGKGSGPGEYQSVTGIRWLGDTLWVSDRRQSSLQGFGRDGRLLSVRRFSIPADYVPRAGGTVIGVRYEGLAGSPKVVFLKTSLGTDKYDTSMVSAPVARPDPWQLPLFLPSPLARISQDGVWACLLEQLPGKQLVVRCDVAGRSQLVRRAIRVKPRPLTTDLWEAAVRAFARKLGAPTAQTLVQFHRAATLPLAFDFLVGPAGELWINRSTPDESVQQWDRYTSDGEPIDVVAVPGNIRAVIPGDGFFIGVLTAMDGLQSIVRCETKAWH